MPGLQSIVKAWTKINYDHVEYVAEEKRRSVGEPGSTISEESSTLSPRRPSSSSSTGGRGDGLVVAAEERRRRSWQHDPASASDNGSATAGSTATVGGIAKLFGETTISGDVKESLMNGVDGTSSSFVIDRPSPTRNSTQLLHIDSKQNTDFTQQHQQHCATTGISTHRQQHFQKSPPPSLPTPSSYLTSNLSSLTFSDNTNGHVMLGDAKTSMRLPFDGDLNSHQFYRRSHNSHQHHNTVNNYSHSDGSPARKSAAAAAAVVTSGRKGLSNYTVPVAADVDMTLNQRHKNSRQLYQAINSDGAGGGAINVGDMYPNSTTPLATNKTQLRPPTHHVATTYSPSRKRAIPKSLHPRLDSVRDMESSHFRPEIELRRQGISRQQLQLKDDLERHQTPEEILNKVHDQYSMDERQRRRGRRSSSLLELFLLEEEQQQLDVSAPKLIVPEEEGDEDEEEHEEGEPQNMMSYHRRHFIATEHPLRSQQSLSSRSRKATTRQEPLSEDRWMQEWLRHTNHTTTSSLVCGSSDRPQTRNSLSSGSSGTTVTANRSLSIRDIEKSSVTMNMLSHSIAVTTSNEVSDALPTDKQRNMYNVDSTNPVLANANAPTTTNHCNRCAQMESAMLALHADLEYLRSLELQREIVNTGNISPDNNGRTTPLPPIDQKSSLYQNANSQISATASTSQSVSSVVTMGSRGSLASSRFGSIARSRQQQLRRQQMQQQQQQHELPQKTNSSPSRINAVMSLRDASKRLTDLSTRHKRQIEQLHHDGAYWQNDMHLKLEKFALMCKNLNEEAACRRNEAKETKALLDMMTSERNALVSEAAVLRAQLNIHKEECSDQSLLRVKWEQERMEMVKDKELAIKHRDQIIDDMARRLELAVTTIEGERKLQIMRRSIIFPQSRPQPSSPSSLQHKSSGSNNEGVGNHTASLDSASNVNDFYLQELKKSKEISAKALVALDASFVQSASREKKLQYRLGMLELELAMVRQGVSASRISSGQDVELENYLTKRRKSM